MSEIQVNKISPSSGTAITLGDSGDTFTIPSGATFTNNGTANGFSSTIETPYAARMQSDVSQSIANTTHTVLTFSTEVYDKGGIADTSTNRITIPSGAGGFWWFTAMVQVDNFRAARNILNFFKNGSNTGGGTTGDSFENGYWGASNQYASSFGSVLFDLSAGDYIQATFYQNSGGADNVTSRSFTAWYLGASS